MNVKQFTKQHKEMQLVAYLFKFAQDQTMEMQVSLQKPPPNASSSSSQCLSASYKVAQTISNQYGRANRFANFSLKTPIFFSNSLLSITSIMKWWNDLFRSHICYKNQKNKTKLSGFLFFPLYLSLLPARVLASGLCESGESMDSASPPGLCQDSAESESRGQMPRNRRLCLGLAESWPDSQSLETLVNTHTNMYNSL